jgi:hypothetical protein
VDGGSNTYSEMLTTYNPLHGTEFEKNTSGLVDSWEQEVEGSAVALVPHVLAVTHSPEYHRQNIGALQRDWPRIPRARSAEDLERSAHLGTRLIQLLDAESDVVFGSEWLFLGALKLPTQQNLTQNLRVTADWGRLQDTRVMPGNGKVVQRAWTDSEVERLGLLATSENVNAQLVFDLLGSGCIDIYLNGVAYWSAVPTAVWNYTLGGYQVTKKWLSYRDYNVLGRPLKQEEAKYFSQIVRRVSAVLMLGPALDLSYSHLRS